MPTNLEETSSLPEEHSVRQVLDPRSLFVAHIFKADCVSNLAAGLDSQSSERERHVLRLL